MRRAARAVTSSIATVEPHARLRHRECDYTIDVQLWVREAQIGGDILVAIAALILVRVWPWRRQAMA